MLSLFLAFQTSVVQTFIASRITGHLSEKLNAKISIKRVDIAFFNKVILNEVLIEDQKADTLFYVNKLVASINKFSLKRRNVSLSSLALLDTRMYVSLDEDHLPNYKFLIDALRKPKKEDQTQSWDISCRNFTFNDTRLGYSYLQKEGVHLIDLYNIQLDLTDLHLHQDSISFRINQLSFDDNKSFTLNELSVNFVSYQHIIKLNDLKLITPNSKIADANFTIDQTNLEKGKDLTYSEVDLELNESVLDFRDLSQFVPSLKGMDLEMNLSGHIYGTMKDLKAKDLAISFGNYSSLSCDFYINGLPNIEESYMYLDLKNMTTDFRDIGKIRLPDSAGGKYPDIPDFLYDAGIIQYRGNFSGFWSDFVAYGSMRSNFGRLDTDLSFNPSANNSLEIKGHLKTVNFGLGRLLHAKELGGITFNGQINGRYQKARKNFTANIDGVIDSIFCNSYQYKNIILDGQLQDQKFEGDLSIDDKNLKARFAGKVDLNPKIPVFDFELLLNRANLVALNIDKKYRNSDLTLDMKANFTGNSIDNLNGTIWFDDGLYANENDFFLLNSLIISTFTDQVRNLQLRSDFIDLDIKGSYSFVTIKQGFENLIHHYLPASGIEYQATPGLNNFSFDVDIKNADPVTQTLFPNLYISPSNILGRFDEKKHQIDLYTEVPLIEYNDMVFKGYSLSLHSDEQLSVKSRLEEFQTSNGQKLYNLAFLSDAKNNDMHAKVVWNNYDIRTYSGEIETKANFSMETAGEPQVNLSVLPTKIYLADTLWTIQPSAIKIDSSRIEVNNFVISNNKQYFALDGVISKDKSERINLKVNEFNLNNLNLIVDKKLNFQGLLSGTASVFDIYEKALIMSDLKIRDFKYGEREIGNISILSKWDRPSQSLQSELIVDNNNQQVLYGYGSYMPSRDSLDFTVNVDNLSLTVLQPVLENSFSNIHGNATGEIKIYGKPDKILMRGDVYGHNAGFSLDYLQMSYYFSDLVKFRGDSIVFDQITVYDFEGDKGTFNGSIRHDNFENMDYDLRLQSSRFLAINTTSRHNEQFYGKIYANGLLHITGKGSEIWLNGSARTMNGTTINISLDYDKEAQVYDFIRFINSKDSVVGKERILPKSRSKTWMNFDVDISPDARFQLIYNSQIGDMIRSQGNGNLQIEIDPDFNINMSGTFHVEKGDYLFTLQNVINKKFEIEQGGSIRWSGDPYNADISLSAIYRLRATLNELFAGTNEYIDQNMRIPVNCKILLTDNLNNPSIAFDIAFPSAEKIIEEQVRQFFSTEEDMNRQILSLLVLGRFYTPEYLRGSYEASNPNLVGTTSSELFSNQLSNWLSQISNDFDIGVNYRPGSQMSNDEIELALSTQIFNDRVTVNGNIGNNSTQAVAANNANIVGDFDINVKLTRNGKLQFKAYNHSNTNIIYETSPYTQGIGLVYRENYDTFDELWAKFTRLFRKKNTAASR
ncbi:translocation/assembly module TamB domain-containing protein [Gaoshiqia sp. Z1-71]|uniref:translocation/assembly module TamB domain-containing protein n=1 Tax=Gaoshiqia hydrogeniformans TaxID=3290090 RepID=UPI003BF8F059